MTSFIQSTEPECWVRILNGPVLPTTIVDGVSILKEEKDYSEVDWKANRFNAKALSLMQCALGPSEFHKVSACPSAKHMWDQLRTTYEGTSLVKESKIGVLTREYELFFMKEGEDIKTFNSRLSSIVNPLRNLGKVFTDEDLVKKVLRSLTRRWEGKMISLSDCKDLTTYKFDDLIGNLLTHEMRFNDTVLDSTPRRSQGLALRHADESESSEESGDEDESIAFIARKFKRAFIKHNGHIKTALRKSFISRDKNAAYQNANSRCFSCGEKGHYKDVCPNKNRPHKSQEPWKGKSQEPWKGKSQDKKGKGQDWKEKEKKKAMVAAGWGNRSSGSSDGESQGSHGNAAICLVGHRHAASSSSSDSEYLLILLYLQKLILIDFC